MPRYLVCYYSEVNAWDATVYVDADTPADVLTALGPDNPPHVIIDTTSFPNTAGVYDCDGTPVTPELFVRPSVDEGDEPAAEPEGVEEPSNDAGQH